MLLQTSQLVHSFTAGYEMLSYAKSRMMETLADLFHRGLVYYILHPVANSFAMHVFPFPLILCLCKFLT